MTEDFKEHPLSIAELRSDKTGKSNDWSPRDLLIDRLRAYDEGRWKPANLVIIDEVVAENGYVDTDVKIAGPAKWQHIIGLLAIGKAISIKRYQEDAV